MDLAEFECLNCGEYFETDAPFGKNVTCVHCGCEMETEMEEDYDNLYFWVTKISPDSPVQ